MNGVKYLFFLLFCISIVSILGVRGVSFEKKPVEIFSDMDDQFKYKTQGNNSFFKNKMNDRISSSGSINRGYEWNTKEVFGTESHNLPGDNSSFYSGRTLNHRSWHRGFPVLIDNSLIKTGKLNYEIFCVNCHGYLGDSNGIVKEYGIISIPTYHNSYARELSEGQIFSTITHGKGQMMGYGEKLHPRERWAIVAYIRILQKSQYSIIEDVPYQYYNQLLSIV